MFLETNRHPTHNCTNPTHCRARTLDRPRGVLGWGTSVQIVPHTPACSPGRTGQPATTSTSGTNAPTTEIQSRSDNRREDSEALKRLWGCHVKGARILRPLLQTQAELHVPRDAELRKAGGHPIGALAGRAMPGATLQRVAGTRFLVVCLWAPGSLGARAALLRHACHFWPACLCPAQPLEVSGTTPRPVQQEGPTHHSGSYPLLPPGGNSLPHRWPTSREGPRHPPGPTPAVHTTFCRAQG